MKIVKLSFAAIALGCGIAEIMYTSVTDGILTVILSLIVLNYMRKQL